MQPKTLINSCSTIRAGLFFKLPAGLRSWWRCIVPSRSSSTIVVVIDLFSYHFQSAALGISGVGNIFKAHRHRRSRYRLRRKPVVRFIFLRDDRRALRLGNYIGPFLLVILRSVRKTVVAPWIRIKNDQYSEFHHCLVSGWFSRSMSEISIGSRSQNILEYWWPASPAKNILVRPRVDISSFNINFTFFIFICRVKIVFINYCLFHTFNPITLDPNRSRSKLHRPWSLEI